jgi:uncharacterized coiled-coil DUF342 family protein
MSDTPETDFVRKSNDCDAAGFCNMMSHARRLERERDAALDKISELKGVIKALRSNLRETSRETK